MCSPLTLPASAVFSYVHYPSGTYHPLWRGICLLTAAGRSAQGKFGPTCGHHRSPQTIMQLTYVFSSFTTHRNSSGARVNLSPAKKLNSWTELRRFLPEAALLSRHVSRSVPRASRVGFALLDSASFAMNAVHILSDGFAPYRSAFHVRYSREMNPPTLHSLYVFLWIMQRPRACGTNSKNVHVHIYSVFCYLAI
jgi:hypothetical protein